MLETVNDKNIVYEKILVVKEEIICKWWWPEKEKLVFVYRTVLHQVQEVIIIIMHKMSQAADWSLQ